MLQGLQRVWVRCCATTTDNMLSYIDQALTSFYRLECSYGHRMRQSRGPAYVAHLENRLKEFETDEEVRKVNTHPLDQSGVVSIPESLDLSLRQSPSSMRTYSSDSSGSSQPDTTNERKRSTSDILNDAKEVLDQMSPHNYTAKCAAQFLGTLNVSMIPISTCRNTYSDPWHSKIFVTHRWCLSPSTIFRCTVVAMAAFQHIRYSTRWSPSNKICLTAPCTDLGLWIQLRHLRLPTTLPG